MLRLKYLLTAILLMMAYVANAQTIQIYKNGAVVKEYPSAEVDSVVYKPAAAQPRYYYYAGWDCPSSVEELEDYADNKDGKKGIKYQCGFEYSVDAINFDMMVFGSQNTVPVDYDNPVEAHYYIVIPENIYIFAAGEINVTKSFYDEVLDVSIEGYNIYRSGGTFYSIDSIKLHK